MINFFSSSPFIVNKGTSYNLMKASAKRRRGKEQIKTEKLEEELRKRDIVKKMAAYDALKAKKEGLE